MPGQEAVQSVNGPLAQTIHDVEIYSKSVVNGQPWLRDPKCIPIPWRSVELPAKLKIAVLWHDGMVHPTPPVERALRDTVERLKAAGHEIIDWDPVDQKQGLDLLARMFVADGGLTIRRELDRTGEPWRPEMEDYAVATELGTYEMWKMQLERTEYQNRHLDRWNKAGIDAILLPTVPFVTVKNGQFKHGTFWFPSLRRDTDKNTVGYTGVYNILDYSSISFPTGLVVDRDIDKLKADYEPLGPVCSAVNHECKSLSSMIAWNGSTSHFLVDADLMHGLPISLQVVARRLEEEKVIAVSKQILEVLA